MSGSKPRRRAWKAMPGGPFSCALRSRARRSSVFTQPVRLATDLARLYLRADVLAGFGILSLRSVAFTLANYNIHQIS